MQNIKHEQPNLQKLYIDGPLDSCTYVSAVFTVQRKSMLDFSKLSAYQHNLKITFCSDCLYTID